MDINPTYIKNNLDTHSKIKNTHEDNKYVYIIFALLALYNAYKTLNAFNKFCDSLSFYNFFSLGSSIAALGFALFNLLPYYNAEKKEDQIIPNEYVAPGKIICIASIAACNILGGVCWIVGCAT
jgi:hypothetical protein